MNERIHDLLIDNDELMFWTIENFRELTGFDDVDEIQDLGDMNMKVTELNSKEIQPSCENCEVYQKYMEARE